MRTIIVSVLVILNVILEATLFQFLRIGGIMPDFIIILIVAYAILEGGVYSSVIGLASGLLIDILFGRVLGVNAFSYMITGYIMGQTHDSVFKDSILPPVLFNFAAVLIYQHLYFFLMYMTGNLLHDGFSYLNALVELMLPQSLYNAILGAVIYRYYLYLNEKDFLKRKLY